MSPIFEALREVEAKSLNPAALPRTGDAVPADSSLRMPDLERVEVICAGMDSEKHVLEQNEKHKAGLEKFRFLSHRLHRLRQERSLRTVLLTSAVPKEGKTVMAINLAATLARTSARVILIDGDMREPCIHRDLGLPALPGLADVLEGRVTLADALRQVHPLGFYYLPAGCASVNPAELLQGPQAAELIKSAATVFDWILVDSPPLNLFADAHCWARLADGVLLVVRAGLTPREALRQGAATLNGTFIAGVVLNAYDDPRQDSYYSHYPRAAGAEAASTAGSGSQPAPRRNSKHG